MKSFLVFILFASFTISAENHEHHKKHKHHHGKHTHGEADVSFGVDQKTFFFELKGPADVFFGFEHRPKNEKQEKLVSNIREFFKGDLPAIISMDEIDQCKVVNHDFKWDQKEKGHSDVEVVIQGECATNVTGKTWTLNLFKKMTHLKEVHLKAVGVDKQVSEHFKSPAAINFSL